MMKQLAGCKRWLAPTAPDAPNHASALELNGEGYFFYHRGAENDGSYHRRSACFDELKFRQDGTIEPVVYTRD
jgi:hypothetical protein